ncbi:MAG: permease [Alphaproteobacteria bacterium]|nr:MAG: permease [Alphaproteobacteria bacterium]
MTAIPLALVAFFSTLCGGLFALKFNDRLHFILSFTAGVLLGVVSFDILPEIFEIAHKQNIDPSGAMTAMVLGFLIFHALEKFFVVHHVHDHEFKDRRHPKVGLFSALALAGHSFMDGLAIGLAFQVSQSVGVVVAIAVIAHDFCDGLNTVGLMLANKNTQRMAFRMLIVDATAPVLGALVSLIIEVPPDLLILYLGFFAGFLLYIGASDILPEAHSRSKPGATAGLILLTCLGAEFIALLVRFMK